MTKKRLGDLLIQSGIISPEQLAEAVSVQQQTTGKLGQILLQLGYVDEQVLIAFLGKQCGVQYVSLTEYGDLPKEAIKLVPLNIVQQQLLIPIALTDSLLTVAMADPLNIFAIDDLKQITGYEIDVVISPESEIRAAIDKYYTGLSNREDIILEEKNAEQVTIIEPADFKSKGISSPTDKIINLIISSALRKQATEIHLEYNVHSFRVRFRVGTKLYDQISPPKKIQPAITTRIKEMAGITKPVLTSSGRFKCSFKGQEIIWQITTLPTVGGEKIVVQIVKEPDFHLDLTQLGFEPAMLEIYQKTVNQSTGVVLIIGPCDAGKKTVLYATLNSLNNSEKNIVSLESEIETNISGITQVPLYPYQEINYDIGLRAILSQNPDILMLDDIINPYMTETVFNIGLNQSLVLAALPASDVVIALNRLLKMNIDPFIIATSLKMIVSVRKVRLVCTKCKEDYEVPVNKIATFGLEPDEVESKKKVILTQSRGCEHCHQTGYNGLTGIYEVVPIDSKLSKLITETNINFSFRQQINRENKFSLRYALVRKVLNRITTIAEMQRVLKTIPEL